MHDIVAKYGLDVHGAAQVEKSQLQRQATQRWNRVRAATRLGVVQEALAYDTGVYGGNVGEDDLDAADKEARTESNSAVLATSVVPGNETRAPLDAQQQVFPRA